MRPTILVLVVLAIFFVALALAPAANARPQGWYLGLGGGWTTLGSVNYALAAPAGPQQSKVNFGDRGEFGMSAGYRLPVPLRLFTGRSSADNLGVKHINSALISLRWYVTSALSAPGPALGTSALYHDIPELSGRPMLPQPSQLNRRFAQNLNFDSSRSDESVKDFGDSPIFATHEAWGLCNRQAAIDPWS